MSRAATQPDPESSRREPTSKKRRRPAPLAWGLLLLLLPAPIAASQGRVVGEVVDENGEGLEDVRIFLRATENQLEVRAQTNRKGRFTAALPETDLTWTIRLEAEGRPVVEEPLGEVSGGALRRSWVLRPPGENTEGVEISPALAAVFNEGADAVNRGDNELAIERFEAVVAEAPDLLQAWRVLPSLYLRTGDAEKAAAAAQRYVELSPEDPLALEVLHDALATLGKRADADSALDRLTAIEQSPEIAIRLYNSGAAAARADDAEHAAVRFREALAMDPGQKVSCNALGNLLLSEKQFEPALQVAEDCLKHHPKSATSLTVRFGALRALGREEEADAAFAQLREEDPEAAANVTLRIGEFLLDRQSPAAALESFEKVLAIFPDHPQAHHLAGLAYLQTGDYPAAKKHLARFLELAPEDPEAPTARELLEALD